MGGALLKENTQDERLLRHTAESLKICLKNHRSSVHALESVISAQKDATEILLQMLSAMPKMGECDSGLGNQPLEKAQSLLSNIQKTLSHECTSLNASYNVLENFICEKLQLFIPESGALMDMEDPKSGCSSKDGTLTYKMERQNDFISNINDPHHREGGANNFGQSENKNSQKEKDELIKIQDENKKQKHKILLLTKLYKERTKTIKDLEKQKNELESDKRRITKDNERNIADLAKQLRHSEEERNRLQNTVHMRECRKTELENEKRKMREKRISVQIFCSQESHLEDNLMEDLATLLKKHLCQEDIEMKLLRQSDISEITPTELLLVLCMSLHASKSEILKAMKGINATKMTAVIMIHLKEPHALPTIASKHKVREEIRRNLGGIFDMAFLRDRDGLYECPMNKRNVGEIVSFIKSFEMIGAASSNN